MNVLILSVSAGGGHMKASAALKDYILSNEPSSKIEIIDTLKYINPILDKLVIGGYIKAVEKSPSLYRKLYNYTQLDNTLACVSTKINEIMAYRLLPLIKNFNPDIIVSTHPFPSEMISILKSTSEISIPVISILTDYASHSFWIYPGIDAYIVSNEDMIYEMTLKGVDENCIFSYGIPVLPSFIQKHDKKSVLKDLGLDANKKTVLIMGGSLGIGKIADVYEGLCYIDYSLQIIVITGNNKKLYNELINMSKNCSKPTKIIGYTENVSKYMQCADILVTKPGGITISEALASNTPMALFSPIPGQEERNSDFLIKHNLAINLEHYNNYKTAFENLFNCNDELEKLKNNCKSFYKPNCGNDIYTLMKKITANAMIL